MITAVRRPTAVDSTTGPDQAYTRYLRGVGKIPEKNLRIFRRPGH